MTKIIATYNINVSDDAADNRYVWKVTANINWLPDAGKPKNFNRQMFLHNECLERAGVYNPRQTLNGGGLVARQENINRSRRAAERARQIEQDREDAEYEAWQAELDARRARLFASFEA